MLVSFVYVADALEMSNEEAIYFDYCIICTGSSYTYPIKPRTDVEVSVSAFEISFLSVCLSQ